MALALACLRAEHSGESGATLQMSCSLAYCSVAKLLATVLPRLDVNYPNRFVLFAIRFLINCFLASAFALQSGHSQSSPHVGQWLATVLPRLPVRLANRFAVIFLASAFALQAGQSHPSQQQEHPSY